MKINLPRIINRSVALRTTLVLALTVTLVVLIGGIVQMTYARRVIAEEMHRQATRSMQNAVKNIDGRVKNIEQTVQTAATFTEGAAIDKGAIYELLEDLLLANGDISAATIMYRADYFKEEGRYFAPTVYYDFITKTYKHDEIGGPEHGFDYLESDSNWVYTNAHNEGYWCLPYVDSISTRRAMVSYSVPLRDKVGSIYAVLCADVPLDWVGKMVEEVKPYDYSDIIVMSRDSQYVFHPDANWIESVNVIQHARDMKDNSYLRLMEHMVNREKGIDTLNETINKSHLKSIDQNESKIFVYFAPIDRVLWSISFTIPENKIMERPNKLSVTMLFVLLLLLIAVTVLVYFTITYQLRPLEKLSKSAREIAAGNFHAQLPVITTKDEIGHLRNSFEDMQNSLSKYIEELKTTTASKASIDSELRIASGIQKAMIPKIFPPFPERDDIDVYGLLTPAKQIGGDLFDFYIRDEKLFFCIGDVSGKGVPASLIMAVTRSLFRIVSAHEASPDHIVAHINETMSQNNESLMFVTLFVGVLDLPTGKIRYCNAGHDAPIFIGKKVGMLPCESNIPIGVIQGWNFKTQNATIDPGTTLFLYTDGLTEAENIDHQLFGFERVKSVANQLKEHYPQVTIEQMMQAVRQFVGEASQSDDLTMLAIQYTRQKFADRFQQSIVMSNDIKNVPKLNRFVDEVCETAHFDATLTMQMNLAIEEAVVNVMNYAYPPGMQGEINIVATINDQRLKFIISDSGSPFDPTAKGEADTTLSAEDRPIGGLGIFLVRQLMDSINYERQEGQNVLTLRKRLNNKEPFGPQEIKE